MQIQHKMLWLIRWSLGGLFIYLGLAKALDPVTFLKQLHQYNALSEPLALNVAAATLPWIEVFCGALLLLGIAIRPTALVLGALLIMFTAAVSYRGYGIHRTKQIALCAVSFDCGCGGGDVNLCRKIFENGFLLIATLALGSRNVNPCRNSLHNTP